MSVYQYSITLYRSDKTFENFVFHTSEASLKLVILNIFEEFEDKNLKILGLNIVKAK